MALGKLVETIEQDFRRSRQNVAAKERLLREKTAEAAERKKAVAAQGEQIQTVKNQNEQLAATVALLEEDVVLNRANLHRQEQHLDMLIQRNRSLEMEFNEKEEKMQKQFQERVNLLDMQVSRFQNLPQAQAFAKAEEERTRLQNLIRILTMREDNANDGFTRTETINTDPLPDVSTFREFCLTLAETAMARRSAAVDDGAPGQDAKGEAEDSFVIPAQLDEAMDCTTTGQQPICENVDFGMEVDNSIVPAKVTIPSCVSDEDTAIHPTAPEDSIVHSAMWNTPVLQTELGPMVSHFDLALNTRNSITPSMAGIHTGPLQVMPPPKFETSAVPKAFKIPLLPAEPTRPGKIFLPQFQGRSAAVTTSNIFVHPGGRIAATAPNVFPQRPDCGIRAPAVQSSNVNLVVKPCPTGPLQVENGGSLSGPFGGFSFGTVGSEGSDDGSDGGDSMFGNFGSASQQTSEDNFKTGFRLNF